jgi:hypothetical protein
LTFDSISIAPQIFDPQLPGQRSWVLTEGSLRGQDSTAIRDNQYKLVVTDDHEEFYDLAHDPYEFENLLLQNINTGVSAAYEKLKSILSSMQNGAL